MNENFNETVFNCITIVNALMTSKQRQGIHVQARQCIGRADGCSLPRVASSTGTHHPHDERGRGFVTVTNIYSDEYIKHYVMSLQPKESVNINSLWGNTHRHKHI